MQSNGSSRNINITFPILKPKSKDPLPRGSDRDSWWEIGQPMVTGAVSTIVNLPPLTKYPRISCSAAAMEPTHSALQRSDQNSIDEIKRVRGAVEAGELPFTKAESDIFLDYAKELYVSKDAKLKEVLISIIIDGGNNPLLMARAICLHLQQLKE
jgi:hypothetical protein